jgi:hypothetical protein
MARADLTCIPNECIPSEVFNFERERDTSGIRMTMLSGGEPVTHQPFEVAAHPRPRSRSSAEFLMLTLGIFMGCSTPQISGDGISADVLVHRPC